MRSDEAGRAGNQRLHANASRTRSGSRQGRPSAIDRGVHGRARGRHARSAPFTHHLVGKLHPHRRAQPPVGADLDLIIVARRAPVLALGLDHRQQHAAFFHLAVGPPERAQQLRPRHLEPDEVVGVVDHAHLVRFGIPHAQRGHRCRHVGGYAAAPAAARRAPGSPRRDPARRRSDAPATRIDAPGPDERGGVRRRPRRRPLRCRPRCRARASSARAAATFSMLCGMNVWPLNPGFTDITSSVIDLARRRRAIESTRRRRVHRHAGPRPELPDARRASGAGAAAPRRGPSPSTRPRLTNASR